MSVKQSLRAPEKQVAPGKSVSPRCAALLAALFLPLAGTVSAAAEEPRGHLAVSYQYIKIDGFESTIGKLDIGTAETHTINFEVDWALNERWSLVAGIPFVSKRYNGPAPHDPASLDPPRDSPFIDDGDYHGRFQDIHVGFRYLASGGGPVGLTMEPFAFLGIPSHDYPFFAHAAVGQNLWKLEVGAAFAYSPPLSDFYFRARPGHVFVEKTLGVSIDHWHLDLEIGYFLNPRLSGRLFVMAKEGSGLEFPDDFPPPRTSELWYQHDRLVKHNYVNAGLGLDFVLSERNRLSLSGMTMIDAEQVHDMQYTLTLGLTRSF